MTEKLETAMVVFRNVSFLVQEMKMVQEVVMVVLTEGSKEEEVLLLIKKI